MKTVIYPLTDGSKKTIEYDETGLCRVCDLPVMEASMGGTDVCPWCDCGTFRNGKKWTSMNSDKIRREAKMNLPETQKRLATNNLTNNYIHNEEERD